MVENVKKEEKWHRISDEEKKQLLAKIREQFTKLFGRKKPHELCHETIQKEVSEIIRLNFKQVGEEILREKDEHKKMEILNDFFEQKRQEEIRANNKIDAAKHIPTKEEMFGHIFRQTSNDLESEPTNEAEIKLRRDLA